MQAFSGVSEWHVAFQVRGWLRLGLDRWILAWRMDLESVALEKQMRMEQKMQPSLPGSKVCIFALYTHSLANVVSTSST